MLFLTEASGSVAQHAIWFPSLASLQHSAAHVTASTAICETLQRQVFALSYDSRLLFHCAHAAISWIAYAATQTPSSPRDGKQCRHLAARPDMRQGAPQRHHSACGGCNTADHACKCSASLQTALSHKRAAADPAYDRHIHKEPADQPRTTTLTARCRWSRRRRQTRSYHRPPPARAPRQRGRAPP